MTGREEQIHQYHKIKKHYYVFQGTKELDVLGM